MIVRAPGKIVLWGEYAVLAGAPAVVMAVDRFASVRIEAQAEGWGFRSKGYLGPSLHKLTPALPRSESTAFVKAAFEAFGLGQLDRPFTYVADTEPFYANGSKIGLGSSAAICVATYVAVAHWLGREPNLATALELHRRWQSGRGSGLDIAASWSGGVIEFNAEDASRTTPVTLPGPLKWQAVWTGSAASTMGHLRDFTDWRESADTETLDTLVAASTRLTERVNLANLADYRDALRDLDRSAGLKIFTPAHDQLGKIATEVGLVYKPCGAGGGDIGIAFGEDPRAIESFALRIGETSYYPISVEIAQHGVKVSD